MHGEGNPGGAGADTGRCADADTLAQSAVPRSLTQPAAICLQVLLTPSFPQINAKQKARLGALLEGTGKPAPWNYSAPWACCS